MTSAIVKMFPELKIFLISYKCHNREAYGSALKGQDKFLWVDESRPNS